MVEEVDEFGRRVVRVQPYVRRPPRLPAQGPLVPISGPLEPNVIEREQQTFIRTRPSGVRYPITVESSGRRGRFGRLVRERPEPWYVRLQDEDGKIFNLRVIASNREEAIQMVLAQFEPKVSRDNIIRVSRFRTSLTRAIAGGIGRTLSAELRKTFSEE